MKLRESPVKSGPEKKGKLLIFEIQDETGSILITAFNENGYDLRTGIL